jgi:hypothetical protein
VEVKDVTTIHRTLRETAEEVEKGKLQLPNIFSRNYPKTARRDLWRSNLEKAQEYYPEIFQISSNKLQLCRKIGRRSPSHVFEAPKGLRKPVTWAHLQFRGSS